MDYEIAWAATAIHDLESLVAYIATDDSTQALRIGEAIVQHTDKLRTFPCIGPVYERAHDPRVRHVICGSYHIFYQVDESPPVVNILHVWHGARSEPPL